MRRLLRAAVALIGLAVLLAAQLAQAFTYFAPGPSSMVGISMPTISQRLVLDSGEHLTGVQMWLDGSPVQPNVAGGLVSYTPTAPLAPGQHQVRLLVQIAGYEPLDQSFGFSVAAGALNVLPAPEPEQLRARDYLNRIRQAAGLAPLSIDASLGEAAMVHAAYVARTSGASHYEAPGSALYAPGDRATYFGFAGSGVAEVVDYEMRAEQAVDGWLSTLYHRLPLVHPATTTMGYGHAYLQNGPDGGPRGANVIDTDAGGVSAAVVPWPYPGQSTVPVGWPGLEGPDPLRLYPGTKGPLGYTVSLTFGQAVKSLTLASATLTQVGGAAVPAMLFNPAIDNHLTDTVALIPYHPLQPLTTYTATFSGSVDTGSGPAPYSKTWSFTTGEAAPSVSHASWQGNTVTLTGSGLRAGTHIFLGGLPVQNLQLADSQCTFTVPAGYRTANPQLLVVSALGQEMAWPDFGTSLTDDSATSAFQHSTLSLSGQSFDVLQIGSAALVPESALQGLGATPTRFGDIGRTYWSFGRHSGDVSQGSTVATVDGSTLLLPLPAQSVGGVNYVPLSFVQALLAAAPVTPPAVVLSDIDTHWARAAILRLVGLGVVSGYPDGTFKPDAPLTRAAFVKLLVAAKGYKLQPGSSGGFGDVDGHWLTQQGYIGAAVQAGIVKVGEYGQGQFSPDQNITRDEIAVMVVRAMGLDSTAAGLVLNQTGGQVALGGRSFADVGTWVHPGYVAVAVQQGIVTGYLETDGSFTYRPTRFATRAEAVVMVGRMLDK